ncbi:proline hydroxylase [Pseudomonas sp. ODNR1LW]|nr:proline hydroxylase [Pseudomonas sp. ODNR1LW]
MQDIEIRINPQLDMDAARRVYERDGLVQISNFLPAEVADVLEQIALTGIDWDLAFQGPTGPEVLSRADIQTVGEPALRARMQAMLKAAGHGYGFAYLAYPMLTAYLTGRDPGHPIHAVMEFLNGEFIRFCAAVTGQPNAVKADGQLTRYRPGDFIGLHNDIGSERSDRLTAYTIGLTRQWRPDWGGQLLFHDDAGDVSRGFAPRWNTLTLFKVPQFHSVAPVSAYATLPRLSVVGWLRNDGR